MSCASTREMSWQLWCCDALSQGQLWGGRSFLVAAGLAAGRLQAPCASCSDVEGRWTVRPTPAAAAWCSAQLPQPPPALPLGIPAPVRTGTTATVHPGCGLWCWVPTTAWSALRR